MARLVRRLEGLSVSGPATVGPLSFESPALLGASVPDELPSDWGEEGRLVAGPAPSPGARSVVIEGKVGRLELSFPIPTPEIAGSEGGSAELGHGAWLLHWPSAEATWRSLEAGRPELLVLANARALFGDGSRLVEAVREIRDRLGARPLLYLPRIALPNRLALLAYLGADLLDATEALMRASEGSLLTAEFGPLATPRDGAPPLCRCAACAAGRPIAGGAHALLALGAELERVRTALAIGRLRELVESRLTSEPALAEQLRYLDRIAADLLEERTPVTGGELRAYVLRESLRRPEVRRFRERFVERYRPPPSKRVLLLVPCSKTKPYRNSPSHRRMVRALEGLRGLPALHIVSVTSPLGLVPRELEELPPCRHYDIPVTGEWDESERADVVRALRHIVQTGRYESVLVHLDREEYGFLETELSAAPHPLWTSEGGRTTGPAALRALHAAAEEALGRLGGPLPSPLAVVREELEEIAALQFGREAARRLFEGPVRLHGRPWFQRVTDGAGTDLATWRAERGLFQLTTAGGGRMLPARPLTVEVADDVDLQGDLFVPGVRRADPSIRIGDAVLLLRGGELAAVGEAELPGALMVQLERGRAVEVRHRVHATPRVAGRQPLDRPVASAGGPVV